MPDPDPGDIVVMDNLQPHKVSRRARGDRGGRAPSCSTCRPTPPTSTRSSRPFAKLKALLRKAAERAIEALWDRIGTLLDAFSAQECAKYFRHAGYGAK